MWNHVALCVAIDRFGADRKDRREFTGGSQQLRTFPVIDDIGPLTGGAGSITGEADISFLLTERRYLRRVGCTSLTMARRNGFTKNR